MHGSDIAIAHCQHRHRRPQGLGGEWPETLSLDADDEAAAQPGAVGVEGVMFEPIRDSNKIDRLPPS